MSGAISYVLKIKASLVQQMITLLILRIVYFYSASLKMRMYKSKLLSITTVQHLDTTSQFSLRNAYYYLDPFSVAYTQYVAIIDTGDHKRLFVR